MASSRTLDDRFIRPRLPRVALAALALAFASGCVTRTVYVVDDHRDRPVAAAPQVAPQAEPSLPPRGADVVGPEEFYEPLAPYGTWHAHPRYGYVWSPSASLVGVGWRPYTRGHWVYTEWGWTWASDLPFGWATFHYGNWFYDAAYGWVWVPGTRWAPAWVTWRTGGGYIGWAPLPPGAVYGASYSVYDTAWIFVTTPNFGASVIYPVMVTGSYYRNCLVVTRPYRTTYVVHGSTYYRGPDPKRVQREGGRVVHRPIRDVDRDRPTTRPPRGVRVSTAGHGGHDGSVGSRQGDRRGRGDDSRARPRERDDRVGRGDGDRSGRGDGRGRGEGRGRGDERDRIRDRDDERPRRGDGRTPMGERDDDSRGRGRGDDGRSSRNPSERGQTPDGSERPGVDGQRPPAGKERVTPPGSGGSRTPFPDRGDGERGRGGDRGQGNEGNRGNGDGGGVPANKDVVRPDGGEVRPPSDNPYNNHPGNRGGGLGSQSAPPARGGTDNRSGLQPSDSRFDRRLPSRFGNPAPTPPSSRTPGLQPSRTPGLTPPSTPPTTRPAPPPTTRAPLLAPDARRQTPTRSPGYGAPSQRPAPSGAGRVAPAPAPARQPARMQPSQAPRATPPATSQPSRSQAPAARSQKSEARKDDKKSAPSQRRATGERRSQSRSRR